ncbi:unnamed protein product [Leptidea sinapis]|uniref:CAF1B/HIR1 beta-propeller domain-containing protein n=1 Tax=Leptidea sinapis TaxID=189913 RepID=A0A5E4QL82_9NEOP|nr:unnamed protein product [Leptidea sinapis]
MKLLKPNWVNHDAKPIFSIDIHPAGKRFATGGQGLDSGRVVVWNLNPVLFEEVEMDLNVPKMLCQMDNHLACVNSVRWSNGGRYLASGGDDRLIMVWGLSVAVGAGKHKAETWRCLATLRGHAGDVLDLAWSPLDKWLASCSVDNTIIIWNAEKFPEMVCVLNGHTGLVKGVAWDPVGKYLASQSDDKSLRVWKTADWGEETVITEPFEECGGTTHVLRLSWSPDGQYILSAHAMNGGGPTAQRFNNNILVKEGKKCCCAAVGSRDRALSIWLTSLKRPLVVIYNLFSDSHKPLYTPSPVSTQSSPTPLRPMDRQIETRTSDGKRRITPVFIPLTNVDANGLDQRLRKRAAAGLPGPRAHELSAKRARTAGPAPPAASHGAAVPHSLPVPVLGTAGPVVNKACNTPYGTLSRLELIPNNSASNDPVWETYLGEITISQVQRMRAAQLARSAGGVESTSMPGAGL